MSQENHSVGHGMNCNKQKCNACNKLAPYLIGQRLVPVGHGIPFIFTALYTKLGEQQTLFSRTTLKNITSSSDH